MPGHIIVAGDASIDWITFAGIETSNEQERRGENVSLVSRRRGAALLTRLLVEAENVHHHQVLGPSSEPAAGDPVHSILDLGPPRTGSDNRSVVKVDRLRRIHEKSIFLSTTETQRKGYLEILVVQDSSNGFRSSGGGLSLVKESQPLLLVYQMARPLATGTIWKEVLTGSFGSSGENAGCLIVIVDASDLRAEGIELSQRLSWEKTCEDFVRQLASNGRLDSLVTCAHLIVRFDCDGVIYHQGRGLQAPTLYFDTENIEGDFAQHSSLSMVGVETAFTAGFTLGLAKTLDLALAQGPISPQAFETGIREGILLGLSGARRLVRQGFSHENAPDYPIFKVMDDLKPDQKISAVRIPAASISAGSSWSILEDVIGDPIEIAYDIVKNGPDIALNQVPIALFGPTMTADRHEIESFRCITNLVQEYLAGYQPRPLCIGVFGFPGSGKSFGVKQVIMKAAQGRRPMKRLEFNLSQFTDYSDLLGAFQLIRDETLSGGLPLVLFDEFDATFRSKLGWLRYFLAPMQDGEFWDQGRMHPLGQAIFVFIGGTSPTFERFTKGTTARFAAEFAACKGPDFISRLRGFVNVRGPDPYPGFRGPDPNLALREDRMYSIRRAILLRALLEPRISKKGQPLLIDDSVLYALLKVSRFSHGARSLEAILVMSRLSGRGTFERAALPSEAQLNLHVNAEEFMGLVRKQSLPEALRDAIGKEIHRVYRQELEEMVERKEEPESLLSAPNMSEWDELEDGFKESSRLQADDIPHKLRMINCYMAERAAGQDAVTHFDDGQIIDLAMREHERYNAERLQRHWQLGPRDSTRRESPFLVPWESVKKHWQDVDRVFVRCIPDILDCCGYQVSKLRRGPVQTPSSAT